MKRQADNITNDLAAPSLAAAPQGYNFTLKPKVVLVHEKSQGLSGHESDVNASTMAEKEVKNVLLLG
jgi:hypothetical protein